MNIENLSNEQILAIRQQLRAEYRRSLEIQKEEMGLAIFLNDEKRQEQLRVETARLIKCIEYYDAQIKKLLEPTA